MSKLDIKWKKPSTGVLLEIEEPFRLQTLLLLLLFIPLALVCVSDLPRSRGGWHIVARLSPFPNVVRYFEGLAGHMVQRLDENENGCETIPTGTHCSMNLEYER